VDSGVAAGVVSGVAAGVVSGVAAGVEPGGEPAGHVDDTAADATTADTTEMSDEDARALERAELSGQLRDAIAARKQADGLMTYDDLLHALRRALQDPARGAQARQVLRRRYR